MEGEQGDSARLGREGKVETEGKGKEEEMCGGGMRKEEEERGKGAIM